MVQLSADDASLLAILAVNPKTTHWERLVERIQDRIARQAALIIVGQAGQSVEPDATRLAEDVQRWAVFNRTRHAAVAS